jgi:hypothetical protein
MRRRKWKKDRGEKRMIEEAVTFRSEVENVQKIETTKKTETLFEVRSPFSQLPTAFLFFSIISKLKNNI